MKVGKEGIVGVMEALEQWSERDVDSAKEEEMRNVDYGHQRLSRIDGVSVSMCADPTGIPIVRLRVDVDPARARITAFALTQLLAKGDPIVKVRNHHVDQGYFFLDPRHLLDGEMKTICDAIERIMSNPPKIGILDADENLSDLLISSLLRWPG